MTDAPAPSGAVRVVTRERGLLAHLAASGRLGALVDPAGQPAVYAHLRALAARTPAAARPLAAGPLDSVPAALFPWLVRVDNEVLAWLAQPETAAAEPVTADDAPADDAPAAAPVVAAPPRAGPPLERSASGVYVLGAGPDAPLPLDAVRRQLARLLTVVLPEGDRVHLRIADPVALPALLGASTATEVAAVFGMALAAVLVARPDDPDVQIHMPAGRPARIPAPTFRVPRRDPSPLAVTP